MNVEQIKKHPFFYGVDWNMIRNIEAPFIPRLRSITDTSYFPTDELDQVPDEPVGADTTGAHKDLAFLGYVVLIFFSRARSRRGGNETKGTVLFPTGIRSRGSPILQTLSDLLGDPLVYPRLQRDLPILPPPLRVPFTSSHPQYLKQCDDRRLGHRPSWVWCVSSFGSPLPGIPPSSPPSIHFLRVSSAIG